MMERFEEICRALADPAFYPHAVPRLERLDTHISAVFLTGNWVYKLKKPVDFGFLDFSTLEARCRYCRQEVCLNQRLSHDVYEGVVEIHRDAEGRFFLGQDGEPVEYAVKMRQLPDEARLETLLRKRIVGPEEMRRLGELLAEFYEKSARSLEIDRFGAPEVIELNMEENFRQIEPFTGGLVPAEQWEFCRQVCRAFFRHWKGLFQQRVEEGRIRDGHGDLRAEHIYFCGGVAQIIDCIEFNDRFRYGDAISDLAFLHMDLEHLGYPDLSLEVLTAYVCRAEDPELYSLLDFYAAYRAVVKLKVACLRSTEVESDRERAELKAVVEEYLGQAYRYALQFSRPTLWVFCGLPASGKSALAGRLSETLRIRLFESDRVRKEEREGLSPGTEVSAFGRGMYRSERRGRVYAQLFALVQEEIKKGHSAVLDATFSHCKWRDDARQLAADLDCNLLFVECICPREVLRGRLEEREAAPGLSDARLIHLDDMIRCFDPIEELPPEMHLRVETDRDIRRTFEDLLAKGYARKCAQVRALL